MFWIALSSAQKPDVLLWLMSAARTSIFCHYITHWSTLLNTLDTEGILLIEWLRRLGQWASQDLLLHDNASRSAVNQQHTHCIYRPTTSTIFSRFGPIGLHSVQRNERTTQREKNPNRWRREESYPRLCAQYLQRLVSCRYLQVTREMATVGST